MGDFGRQSVAASRPAMAADLEDVGEVRVERERERGRDRAFAVVRQRQALVQPLLPEQARPLDVNHALRRCVIAELRKRAIREIRPEDDVVATDAGTEQRRRRPADRQPEERQHAGIVAKQPVGTALDIAEHVRDQEDLIVLQRERADRAASVRSGVGDGISHACSVTPRSRPTCDRSRTNARPPPRGFAIWPYTCR